MSEKIKEPSTCKCDKSVPCPCDTFVGWHCLTCGLPCKPLLEKEEMLNNWEKQVRGTSQPEKIEKLSPSGGKYPTIIDVVSKLNELITAVNSLRHERGKG